MSPTVRILVSLALVVLALAAAPSAATTLIALDDGELIDQSTLIVTGSCIDVRREWRQGMLLTLASVRVDRVLKGEPSRQVTVVIPGGVDFDREVPVAVKIPGAPTLLPSERVLLFLEAAGTGLGELSITGFSQGKLSILERDDGTPMVRRDLAGVSLVDGHRLRSGGRRAMPLAVLEEQIVRRAARVQGSADRDY